jgi:hypothetical protein
MPIYDFGYRGYNGTINSHWLRWLVIARQGVALAMRRRLLRRMLFLSWTPMLYFSVIFFMIGSITEITPKPPSVPGLNEPGFWKTLWEAQNPLRLGYGNLPPPQAVGNEPEILVFDGESFQHRPKREKPYAGVPMELPPLSAEQRRWLEMERRRHEARETTNELLQGIRGKDRWIYERAARVLGPSVALRFVYDAPNVRSAAWTTCFYYYVVRVQTLVMIFVVMMVAPPLVANDLRGKSFLIYFSSAITRRDYILGKLAVVMFVIASVTILPGIALYAISIAFAPSIGALADTFHVLLRMSLAIFAIGVPASLGALYLSSRTTHPRFAAFSWIAVWVMGAIFETAISHTVRGDSWLKDAAFLLSPYRLMTVLAEWIFGVREQLDVIGANHFLTDRLPPPGYALAGLAFVVVLSVLSIVGIWRRITAPMSV